MRWLITGAGGMLGRELVAMTSGENVVALNRNELDIRDPRAVMRAADGADLIVNAAAWTDVDAAESHEEAARAVNALGAENIARAAAAAGARLIHLSTDYVFDGASRHPYDEDAPAHPLTAYGRTKAEGERRVMEVLPDRTVIVRTSWLYGGSGRSFPRRIAEILRDHGRVNVVSDQHGQPTWTRDVAERVIEIARRPISSGILHASGAGECTWYDFARDIAVACGHDATSVRPVSSVATTGAARRPAYSVLGHAQWAAHGLPEMRHWRAMFQDAAPYLDLPTRRQEKTSS